jgi:hypothetical protein
MIHLHTFVLYDVSEKLSRGHLAVYGQPIARLSARLT